MVEGPVRPRPDKLGAGFSLPRPELTARIFPLLRAPVAQLDRASACGAGGRRFEPCRAHQFLSFARKQSASLRSSRVSGSNPAGRTSFFPSHASRAPACGAQGSLVRTLPGAPVCAKENLTVFSRGLSFPSRCRSRQAKLVFASFLRIIHKGSP